MENMKKLIMSLTAGLLLLAAASAYEPPVQGENLFYLSHPELLTEGNSTAGGGLQSVLPASGTINPALIGLEERVTLDLGYTGMFNSKPNDGYTGVLTEAWIFAGLWNRNHRSHRLGQLWRRDGIHP